MEYIVKICAGSTFSLFQNTKGEIYACGSNKNGQLGIGSFKDPVIRPSIIPNLPGDIIEFSCGSAHSLFLDDKGRVFSTGYNGSGMLGLGHFNSSNKLNEILNIPPIQTISCTGESSFLLDYDGNVWSFGNNACRTLGHGDENNRNIPEKIQALENIEQISGGCFNPSHFICKDQDNVIYVMGKNITGQLGLGSYSKELVPTQLLPKFSTIWGDPKKSERRVKSARK